MRVDDLLKEVAAEFAAADLHFGHGTDNAWDEAVYLVLGALQLPDDVHSLTREISVADSERVQHLVSRRVHEHVPVAYLLSEAWYLGRPYMLATGVMVPRSPIGSLLPDALTPWLQTSPKRILDLCAGCGPIGIHAAHCYPDAQVVLAELDPLAAGYARRNVLAHGMNDRVGVVEGDLFAEVTGKFDLILTNPPYVSAEEMAGLAPEYRHEPPAGLGSGQDGMDCVARILEEAPAYLAPSGVLVCEVGANADAFIARFPDLSVVWLDLPAGGEGVFLMQAGLEAWALGSHTARLTGSEVNADKFR